MLFTSDVDLTCRQPGKYSVGVLDEKSLKRLIKLINHKHYLPCMEYTAVRVGGIDCLINIIILALPVGWPTSLFNF